MKVTNPYALYVNCDGAMDYDGLNSGGIGFVISFPDFIDIPPITVSHGTFVGGNIETLELQALIQAMEETINIYFTHSDILSRINSIIFVTDRFGLKEDEKTSPYRIQEWRRNRWKNHEGKPIKNHKLLDELDKTRTKLARVSKSRIHIEYRPRKKNKIADKLAKAGKKIGIINEKLAKKGEKIGRRKFNGAEIPYAALAPEMELHVNIFRKDPVQDEWEVWAELCDGEFIGRKLKIYAVDELACDLQRGNQYFVKVKTVFRHHIHVFHTVRKIINE